MNSSTLLCNARLWSTAQADAVLVRGPAIAAVGETRQLRREHPAAREIDLSGALLLPGIVDTHTHFYEWARKLAGVDLAGTTGLREIVGRLKAHARELPPDGEWIGGGGWDPALLHAEKRPNRTVLDEIFPRHPVILESRDFHTLWVNGAALDAAGIDEHFDDSQVPTGGRVGRDQAGKPDGLLYETAWDLVRSVRPPETDERAADWIRKASAQAHRFGLTGVHCMEPQSTLEHYRAMRARDQLSLRVCFHTPLDHLEERIAAHESSYPIDDAWLQLGGVKIFMDGSLGSRSACMHQPYPDGGRGTLLRSAEELIAALDRAALAQIAGSVHAIGDRTVEIVADAFVEMRRRHGPELRHRMEHAQCVRPREAAKLAAANVFCAMQPVHLLDDGPILAEEWGSASDFAYPCRSLLREGVALGFGSDVPVASPDPRLGIAAALTRRWGPGPNDVHRPEECLGVDEVLAAYTSEAARSVGLQSRFGRIEVGMLADLTAIDDVLGEGGSAWTQAVCRLTMVDGIIRHEELTR